jgi:hypothetical protein
MRLSAKDVYILASMYRERKITASLENVTARGGKKMERARGSAMAKSLSQHV